MENSIKAITNSSLEMAIEALTNVKNDLNDNPKLIQGFPWVKILFKLAELIKILAEIFELLKKDPK